MQLLAKRKSVKNINDMFRERNNQVECAVNDEVKKPSRGFNNKNTPPKHTTKCNVEYKSKPVEKYNSRDILYFYKDLATKNGIRFVSNLNLDKRYMRNIKMLQENFENQAIIDMYVFLFESGQNYLDMRKSHPGILLTGWCNRIMADTQDYLDGCFNQNSKLKDREYNGDKNESTLGEW